MASSKQLTVFVTLQIKLDRIEEWKAAHQPVWDACAAEPECMFFDVLEDAEIPGRFRFVEVWNGSREWFETKQMTKSYYGPMWEMSRPTWEKDPQVEYYEPRGESSIYRKGFLGNRKSMD